MMRKTKCILLFLVLGCGVVRAQVAEHTTVNARLSFTKKDKKIHAEIILDYKVQSNDSMFIGNLRDYYGTPGIAKYMTAIKGVKGTYAARKANSDSLVIVPADKKVSFAYTLVYDSALLSNATYAPNTGIDHLHFSFCQWMLPVAERKTVLDYHIRIGNLPGTWLLYSSAGDEATEFSFRKSLFQSFSMVIGAGNFQKVSHTLRGRPVNIYIKGDFKAGNKKIASLIQGIISYQRTIFDDFDFKFYSVVLLPKEGNIAGMSISNMFHCHLKKDVEYSKLAWLASHEMQHRWVGNKLYIRDTTSFGLRHQWFSEGIDDYLAYIGLLDSKLFTRDEFVNSINGYLRNIKENPYAAASEDSLIAVADRGKYGVEATKLAYYKGMLIGFLADIPFREGAGSRLHSGVRDLVIKLVKENHAEMTEEAFFSLSDSMQLPLRELYRKHIIAGSDVFDLPPSLFSGAYKLSPVTYPVYDPGFTYSRKDNRLYITHADPAGPAYQAGIREGMEIIKLNAVNRFSNTWCDCPLRLMTKTGEREEAFEYMPGGKDATVLQYIKK